jgi:conjugative transfer region protein (TIGR03748 family)
MKVIYNSLYFFSLLVLFVMSSAALANGAGNRYSSSNNSSITHIDRYSTVENRATIAQINPLMAVAQFKFQPNVRTVGDAINQVLQNTSYKLIPSKSLPLIARETLSKPLPITVRTIGPIRIKEAVLVFMGKEVFDLIVDPAHRLINFRVKQNIAHILGVHHGRH